MDIYYICIGSIQCEPQSNYLDEEEMPLATEPAEKLESDSEDDLKEVAKRLSGRPNEPDHEARKAADEKQEAGTNHN